MIEITIVRGDTLKLSLDRIIRSDGSAYTLSDSDIIYMNIRKADSSGAVIKKELTSSDYSNGVLTVTLLPKDTAMLPIGDYLFDMRLFMDKDNIFTVIPASKLRIVRNITDIPDERRG